MRRNCAEAIKHIVSIFGDKAVSAGAPVIQEKFSNTQDWRI